MQIGGHSAGRYQQAMAYICALMVEQLWQSFVSGLLQTTPLECIAVVAGIISVVFSRRESIWVFPTGLVNTILFIYLSIEGHLYGEASVNLYYTIMSIYGWWLWTRKDTANRTILHITPSSRREWVHQLLFFGAFYTVIFGILHWLSQSFAKDTIPWADALASASAYTGMWLMARKKIESWIWWIVTNIVSIPLWFVKGYVFTSVQFMVLLVLAVAGLLAWQRKYRQRASAMAT